MLWYLRIFFSENSKQVGGLETTSRRGNGFISITIPGGPPAPADHQHHQWGETPYPPLHHPQPVYACDAGMQHRAAGAADCSGWSSPPESFDNGAVFLSPYGN